MFIKYIAKNLKHNFFSYLLIAILEVLMLCVVVVANGIITNTIVEENDSIYWSKTFSFAFEHGIKSVDFEDKINEFAEKLPYEFHEISMQISPIEAFYDGNLFFFYDYNSLKNFMKENFNISDDQLPTKEEFDNKEKVVMVGSNKSLSLEHKGLPSAYECVVDGYINIMGEKYKVSGYYGGVGMYILWGTQPEDTVIHNLIIEMQDAMTDKQTEEIMSLYNNYFGDIHVGWQSIPKESTLLDKRVSEANIVISVVLIIISVFNTLLIFKYMLSMRKQSFAVFRLCGFGKLNCILYSGAEFLLLSAGSAAISCVVFDKLVKPIMVGYYGIFNIIFDINYYLVVSAGYIGISLVMFLIYIVPSLTKSVTAELRGI